VVQEEDGPTWLALRRGGLLAETGGIGGLLARTEPLAFSLQHSYFHADAVGNITCLVNGQQVVVARYLYDPFGNLLSLSGPLAEANLYRFASKELHPNSGLIYFGFRYYAPNLQRWLNADPLEEEGEINLYEYCRNQPLTGHDNFGELSVAGHFLASFLGSVFRVDLMGAPLAGWYSVRADFGLDPFTGMSSQSSGNANRHAMRAPGQSVTVYRASTARLIRDGMDVFVDRSFSTRDRYRARGCAEHTVQDGAVWAHTRGQGQGIWHQGPLAKVAHFLNDWLNPIELIKAIVKTITMPLRAAPSAQPLDSIPPNEGNRRAPQGDQNSGAVGDTQGIDWSDPYGETRSTDEQDPFADPSVPGYSGPTDIFGRPLGPGVYVLWDSWTYVPVPCIPLSLEFTARIWHKPRHKYLLR
jgi:RHS repeat-associated protein